MNIPEVAMKVEESDVEFSFNSVEFFEQEVRDEQTAHQEESVDRYGGIGNALEPPGETILLDIK